MKTRERLRFVFTLDGGRELVVYAPSVLAARRRLRAPEASTLPVREAGRVDREGRLQLPAHESSRLLIEARRAPGA